MDLGSPIFTVEWPHLLGGGAVGTVLLLALVERLRRTFATRTDLNGFGERVNNLDTHYAELRRAVDDVRERLGTVETEQKLQWERVMEQVIKPLERITDKLETVGKAQAAQATALDHIGKWLDRVDEVRGGSPSSRRRP